MRPRLDELEEDLLARRERAVAEGWRGEIDGVDLTLTFLRSSASRPSDSSDPARSRWGFP